MVLEKTLESSLDCKEIKPVHPKRNQSWILFGRTDVEAQTPIFLHLMQRTDSLEKTLMLEKIEGRRGWLEDEMVGWHHWLDGHEFEQAPGAGDGQGSLAGCSPWGCRVGHDWTELKNVNSTNRADRKFGIHGMILALQGFIFAHSLWKLMYQPTWNNLTIVKCDSTYTF